MTISAKAVLKAVEICGGQPQLAQRLDRIQPPVKQGHVWAWIHRYPVPPKHFDGFEIATVGQVTRYDLRPDIFPPPSKSQIKRLVAQAEPPHPLRRHTDKPRKSKKREEATA
jgi:DNA-binding transcriptional regulator YdaS (Cro superfamily)